MDPIMPRTTPAPPRPDTQPTDHAPVKPARHVRTLRLRVLLSVNATLGVALLALLIGDYQIGLADRLAEKHVSLEEEAKILVDSVDRLRPQGDQAVQAHIDRVCGQMQESASPGHHIAARIGDRVLQAQSHGRASAEMFAAMEKATRGPNHRAVHAGRAMLVGSESQDDVTIYVSEYEDSIRRTVKSELIGRLIAISLLGLFAAVMVNVILVRAVTRPLNRLVLGVRRIARGETGVRTGEFGTAELQFLANEIDSMSAALDQAEQSRQKQMDKARRIQDNLKPTSRSIGRVTMGFKQQSADEVGGDYFDLFEKPDGSVMLCVADVTGHGFAAAMGAAMLKALTDSASDHSSDPADILAEINRGFARVSLDGDFATVAIAKIDTAAGVILYASAGHETSLLISPDGSAKELRSTGLIIGVDPDAQWRGTQTPYQPGDRLVLFTDGLVEAASPRGVQFGRDRFRDTVIERSLDPMEAFCRNIFDQVLKHTQHGPPLDDMTLLVADL
jgi:phosphoserine phosphatase RsbU/P